MSHSMAPIYLSLWLSFSVSLYIVGSLAAQPDSEVVQEVLPFLRVLKNGTIDRLVGTGIVPPGTDPKTSVVSKDILIIPETGIKARLYRPAYTGNGTKLPLVVYFHGGAFCTVSVATPTIHNSLNIFAAEAKVVIVSVDYRLVPEHPLPAAYEDSWAALQWVALHVDGNGSEEWLKSLDFNKIFLAGDSAGANIAHHLAIRAGSNPIQSFKIHGLLMIHPYFWGKNPIGVEKSEQERRGMVDSWWKFVCPSDKGNDDPYINPFVNEAPPISLLACERVLVCVAGNDILRDRGITYYEKLVNSEWTGKAQLYVTKGEDHVFYQFNLTANKTLDLVNKWALFINKN